jgi:hypothetical protein
MMTTTAKKAPARKPAAKKATPKSRTPVTAQAPAQVKMLKTIWVEGRDIEVKMPTAEQLMAWEATLTAISKMHASSVEYDKIRTHIDRYYRIAKGLFVHDEDKEWLEEGRLDGVISIEKDSVLGMISAVIEVYKEQMPGAADNRAARRAVARKKA